MKIYIGADHRGFELKNEIKEYLEVKGHDVIDKGAFEYNKDDDYPDFAFAVSEAVAADSGSKGVLLCGSSIGVCVASNKVKGIFCSQVRTPEEASEDIKHHDSKVLALSADKQDIDTIKEILDVWFGTEFEGGRHERRLEKIWNYENLKYAKMQHTINTEKGLILILLFALLAFLIVTIINFLTSGNKLNIPNKGEIDVEVQNSNEQIKVRSDCNNTQKTTGEKCYKDINYAIAYATSDADIILEDGQYTASANRLEPSGQSCWKLRNPNDPNSGYDSCNPGDRCGTVDTTPCPCQTADSTLEGYDSPGKIKPGAICPLPSALDIPMNSNITNITIKGSNASNKTLVNFPPNDTNGHVVVFGGLNIMNISIENIIFRGGSANTQAAIAVDNSNSNVSLTLKNVTFDGIQGFGVLIGGNNKLYVSDAIFSNTLKAAIELRNSAIAEINHTEFISNKDSAVNLLENSKAKIKNSVIKDSAAAGIVLRVNSSAEIYNTLLSNNKNYNAGVYDNSDLRLVNNVIVGSSSKTSTGVLAANSAKITLINNLIVDNKLGIDTTATNTSSLIDYNFFHNNTTNHNISDSSTIYKTNNIIDQAPNLGTNYVPQTGSRLIDGGDSTIKDKNSSRSDIGLYGGPEYDNTIGSANNSDSRNSIRVVVNTNPGTSPTPTQSADGCGYPSTYSYSDLNKDNRVDIKDLVCLANEYKRVRQQ